MDAALLEHEGGHVKDGGIKDTKGGYIYEVEVTDRKGQDWDMAIDATTGALLKDGRTDARARERLSRSGPRHDHLRNRFSLPPKCR